MTKYLVTGGAGFIGSNLVRFLLGKDQHVVVLDNLVTGKLDNLADVRDRVEFIEADVRDRQAVDRAAAGCSAIFHEAALGSVPLSIEKPEESLSVNVGGTANVLEAARSAGIKRVVLAASSAAYGDSHVSPKTEDMPTRALSPYAASKIAGESLMQAYAVAYGMETVSLRYFNVFGPRQDPNGPYAAVIPAFVNCLLRQIQPKVFGDGEQTRDFCFVEDVCRANWLASQAPAEACNGDPINVGGGRETSLNRLLDLLAGLLEVEFEPDYQPARVGDPRQSLADIRIAAERLGYRPEVSVEEGLSRTIEWYRQCLEGA